MNMLTPVLEGHEWFWITYRCVRTEAMAARERVYLLKDIGTNPIRMALAFFRALWVLLKERPHVLISTGAEIAIPFSWVAKLLGARVVYIETWSRVHTRSGTGPLVYPVTDLFLVQWPDVLCFYGPKARYEGGIV